MGHLGAIPGSPRSEPQSAPRDTSGRRLRPTAQIGLLHTGGPSGRERIGGDSRSAAAASRAGRRHTKPCENRSGTGPAQTETPHRDCGTPVAQPALDRTAPRSMAARMTTAYRPVASSSATPARTTVALLVVANGSRKLSGSCHPTVGATRAWSVRMKGQTSGSDSCLHLVSGRAVLRNGDTDGARPGDVSDLDRVPLVSG